MYPYNRIDDLMWFMLFVFLFFGFRCFPSHYHK